MLEKIMAELSLKNNDLVKASAEQLTHKMVAKARKGKPLTPNVQMKILNALNACQNAKQFTLSDLLFNKQGTISKTGSDP